MYTMAATLSFAQKPTEKSKLEKFNLRQMEKTTRKGYLKKEKNSNIARAKYNEFYVSKTHKNTDSVAISYLKSKHSEFGLSSDLSNIRVKKVRQTPGGKYVYFEQHINDIPVFSSECLVGLNKGDTVTFILNNLRKIEKANFELTPKLNATTAIKTARDYIKVEKDVNRKPKAKLVLFESEDKGFELAWQINLIAMQPLGDWLVFVNALNNRIIHVEDIALGHNGRGMIFNPNPITSAETTYGGDYVDNSDNNSAVLEAERISVVLRDITLDGGVYKLEGPYCVLDDVETPSDIFPELTDPNGFNYTRDQQEFEAVMVYYHIDMASRRVEDLGYNEPDLRTFSADPHGLDGADNSHFVPSGNYVSFGEGGVDDAEDADIIWHEYGHALQWHLGTGSMSYSGETMSVQEGSSDYWAVSYSRSVSSYNWGIWANWDGHNTFWDGRRADLNWVYPTNYVAGHNGGQIWSSALMKIWTDLGRDITDRLFLETHFIWGSSPSMEDAAASFIQADRQLYGGVHVCTIIEHFRTHGLTDLSSDVVNVSNRTITTNETINGCDVNVDNVEVKSNSKLTIDAENNVIINGEFKVELGSELEIK